MLFFWDATLLPVKSEKRDGRHARAERTHQAIVNALLDLAEEGNLSPTAQQIADRADIALRSIRQHFASREALFLAAAETHSQRRVASAVIVRGTLKERVAGFVRARSLVLEQTSALRRAASLEEESSQTITRVMSGVNRARRSEVLRAFDKEFERKSAKDRKRLVDALDLASCGRSWDAMRREMNLSTGDARGVMETTLSKLLAD